MNFRGTDEKWEYQIPTSKFDACTKSESGKIIGYAPKNSPEDRANERLRAASLDLFKALKSMVDNIDEWLETGKPADKETSKRLYELAKKALAKAVG